MNTIKILLADDNVLAAKSLGDRLVLNDDFEILGIARDGLETITIIEKEKPDVVLLDIIMPKLDGIGVLEYFNSPAVKFRPVFIILSAISQENYISRVMNLGASYYIIKPFDESVLAKRIRQWNTDSKKEQYVLNQYKDIKTPLIQKDSCNDELRVHATKYMREYGLKANMMGYSYIRDIIIEAFDSYCKSGILPKGIYKTIARNNRVTVQKVERAIRNCIEKRIDSEIKDKSPTNSQVICSLIDKIRMNN